MEASQRHTTSLGTSCRKLPRPDEYQVVLVSPSAQAMCRQACAQALISDDMFPQDKLFVGISSMFKSYADGTFLFLCRTTTALDHVTSAPEILLVLRPAIARKAEGYLAQVGVTVRKGVRVDTVRPAAAGADEVAAKATVSLDNGETLDADLYIPATGTRPNTGFVDASLQLLPGGRVNTNPSTLRVDAAGPRAYAIGDASSFAAPAVHNILAGIPVLCANIKRDLLLASENPERAEGQDRQLAEDPCENHLVPVGRSRGVGAAMGHQLPSFMIKGRDCWLWTTGNLWSGEQWAKES